MIEIFRIEHRETQVGPFQTDKPFMQELARRAGEVRYLRHPYDDGLGLAWIPWGFVFGAPSLNALKRWFFLGGSFEENRDIIHELHDEGFELVQYLVEEDRYRMGHSKLQVAFDAKSARDEGLVAYEDIRVLLAESPLVFCTRDSLYDVQSM